MAFPTYPYGYQPGYQPSFYPQTVPDQLSQLRQQMQPAQMPAANQPIVQAPVPQNNGIIWVNNKQEADSFQVLPGSAVALWDSNNPVIYLRQADSTGKPTTKVYDLVERQTDQPVVPPQLDIEDVVTWDKLDQYLTERFKRPSKAAQKKEDTDNG